MLTQWSKDKEKPVFIPGNFLCFAYCGRSSGYLLVYCGHKGTEYV